MRGRELVRCEMTEYKRPCEDCWHFRPAMQHGIESNQIVFGKCDLYGDDFSKRHDSNYASTSRGADWHCGREGKWFDSLLEIL